jgi:hypothetical protein
MMSDEGAGHYRLAFTRGSHQDPELMSGEGVHGLLLLGTEDALETE